MKEKKTTKSANTDTGSLFQRLRLKTGLTQEKAAEDLSCSPRTIQRYEAGDTTPDYPALRRMMDSCNCEAAGLFGPMPLSDKEPGGDM